MSEAVLNIDELLVEIPGENPAGENLRDVMVDEGGEKVPILDVLKEARTEQNPGDYAENDPMRPAEAKAADWPKILRLSTRALTQSSKHLDLGARVTEAATKLHGFAGLAEGLALLRGLAEKCWDRMYPAIEDGEVDVRAGPFDWLGEGDRGARFPHALRGVPVLAANGKTFSYNSWKNSQDGKGTAKDDFDKAVAASPREQCQAAFDALAKCQEEFTALLKILNDRMGPSSPGMTDFRAALGECYTLAKQILHQKGPAPVEASAEAEGDAGGGEAAAGDGGGAGAGGGRLDNQSVANRAMATRADIYRRLQESADLLERIEPHSPIPYLIRRAVELGAMPFPLLIAEVVRDTDLSIMKREFGIKDPA